MAKTAHGGFTPFRGNPSGNGRDQQGMIYLAGVSPETNDQIADRYMESDNDVVAPNVHLQHQNRNVNKTSANGTRTYSACPPS